MKRWELNLDRATIGEIGTAQELQALLDGAEGLSIYIETLDVPVHADLNEIINAGVLFELDTAQGVAVSGLGKMLSFPDIQVRVDCIDHPCPQI